MTFNSKHLTLQNSDSRRYLRKLEIAVDEGPLQELLAGGDPDPVPLVHEDLVEVAVLDLLPCRPTTHTHTVLSPYILHFVNVTGTKTFYKL